MKRETEKRITLCDREILYILRESTRARHVRLAVHSDGSVVITTPYNVKEKFVENFIRGKAQWLFLKIAYFEQFEKRPIAGHKHGDYVKHRAAARLLIEERVEHFNNQYGFNYHKINIKNQKTRWGSCSQRGNLNFNYKLLFLPSKMRDYVIVHEVCHLKELNHSSTFWDLVASIFPDHADIKKELRKYSVVLG